MKYDGNSLREIFSIDGLSGLQTHDAFVKLGICWSSASNDQAEQVVVRHSWLASSKIRKLLLLVCQKGIPRNAHVGHYEIQDSQREEKKKVHPRNLTYRYQMMVWKMHFLSNMAILGYLCSISGGEACGLSKRKKVPQALQRRYQISSYFDADAQGWHGESTGYDGRRGFMERDAKTMATPLRKLTWLAGKSTMNELKMYFILKMMGDFPVSHVSFQGCKVLNSGMDDVCVSFFGQEILMVLPSGRWQFHWLGGFFFLMATVTTKMPLHVFQRDFWSETFICHWNPGRGSYRHNLAIFDWQQTPGIWPLAAQVWIRVVGPECRRFIWCSPWSITTLMWGPHSPIFLPDFFGNCWWIRRGGRSDRLECNFFGGFRTRDSRSLVERTQGNNG